MKAKHRPAARRAVVRWEPTQWPDTFNAVLSCGHTRMHVSGCTAKQLTCSAA